MYRRKRSFLGLMGNSQYQVQRSLRCRASASAYLSQTSGGSPTDTKKCTYSLWFKGYPSDGVAGNRPLVCTTGNNGLIGWNRTYGGGNLFVRSDGVNDVQFAGLWRDPSIPQHLLIAIDTTQATAGDRVKAWKNGVALTYSAGTLPALNSSSELNKASTVFNIAKDIVNVTYLDCYLSEFYRIDGQALTPSSFAETDPRTGQWIPKAYTGTYGANGYYLDFRDNSSTSNLCLDRSGNGNNWTPNNISVTAGATYDSMLDVPTQWGDGGNGRGNYCTLNPLDKDTQSGALKDGNLYCDPVAYATDNFVPCRGTISVNSGAWYWEGEQAILLGTGNACAVGFTTFFGLLAGTSYSSTGNYGAVWPGAGAQGQYLVNGTATASGGNCAAGDIYRIAVNASTGNFWAQNKTQNATWFGGASDADVIAGVTPTGTLAPGSLIAPYTDSWINGSSTNSAAFKVNFGQRPFTYTPPTGYKALNTYNLPEPVILQGNRYVDIDLYTGTGATRTKTGLYFQPDIVDIKGRSGATDWAIYDSVRGVQKDMAWNTVSAQTPEATGLTAFTADGYTTGALAKLNTNTATYMALLMKAGGAAASNTAGSITSSVSAGVAQGISVLTYTGTGANATVGHGLGAALKFWVVKDYTLASTHNWAVGHASLANTEYLLLNSTAAKATGATYWNSTSPTSTVFSIGTHADVNTNTNTYVAYCFTDVAGFSAFGSYAGNAGADGAFVHTGFDIEFLLVKSSTAIDDWRVYDRTRPGYNPQGGTLLADTAGAETTAVEIDFVANGFKARVATTPNAAQTYIYAAFAKNPFKYANAH